MLHTKYSSGLEAQKKLQAGINKLEKAVSVTLGAKGRLAVIQRIVQPPFSTKDGVTVASEFILQDAEEQAGVIMVREASKKTAQQAGDGTTATVILTNAIINEGIKAIESGENAVDVVKKIELATKEVVKYIENSAVAVSTEPVKEGEVDYLKQVATIAANGNSEIGGMIADAYRKIGKNGICNMGEPLSSHTEVRYSKGLRIESGYTDSRYSTNFHKMTSELVNPLVLIYENKVLDPQHIMRKGGLTNDGKEVLGGIIYEIAKLKKPVLFMCDGLDETSTASLLQAFKNNDIKICVAKLPSQSESRKELLKDVAALTGATICGTANGIKISEAKLEHCGQAAKVIVGKDFTVFEATEGREEFISARAEEISGQLNEEEFPISKEELATRLAKLTSGIATIHVGATTDLEQRELLYRVEDAILAVKSALEEGIVVGGGMCLKNAGSYAHETSLPIYIHTALLAPISKLLSNAGIKDVVFYGNDNLGYNVATGEKCDLFKAGIVDAAKVPRCAIQNASSIACQILLTETLLVQANTEIQ